MASNIHHISASDITKQTHMQIIVHGMWAVKLRIRIASALIGLAAFVFPFECEIVFSDEEPS
jgi:hypothetical protein